MNTRYCNHYSVLTSDCLSTPLAVLPFGYFSEGVQGESMSKVQIVAPASVKKKRLETTPSFD